MSYPILLYPILSYLTYPIISQSILPYRNQSHSILSCPSQSYPTLSSPIRSYHPIRSCPILFDPILSYLIICDPILSYPTQSNPIIFYLIPSYIILSYPIPSYSILPCPILSHPILYRFRFHSDVGFRFEIAFGFQSRNTIRKQQQVQIESQIISPGHPLYNFKKKSPNSRSSPLWGSYVNRSTSLDTIDTNSDNNIEFDINIIRL